MIGGGLASSNSSEVVHSNNVSNLIDSSPNSSWIQSAIRVGFFMYKNFGIFNEN